MQLAAKRAGSIPDEPTPDLQEAPLQQTTPDPLSTGGNLLQDPYLKDQGFSKSSSTSPNQQATAMPWNDQLPSSTTTPVPTSKPTHTPQPDPMELLAGSLLLVKVNCPDAQTSEGGSPAESPGTSWLQGLLRRR